MICSFQCTNCSPHKGVPLPSLGLPGSGVRRMGSWKEWCIPPSPLPILSGFVQHRCPGPCSSLLAKSGVPCWEFLPGQSVVDTAVRVSPRTLTMPSMGPSAQDNLQMKDPLWSSKFSEWTVRWGWLVVSSSSCKLLEPLCPLWYPLARSACLYLT